VITSQLHAFSRGLGLLNRRDKVALFFISVTQFLLGLLDLLAVFFSGLFILLASGQIGVDKNLFFELVMRLVSADDRSSNKSTFVIGAIAGSLLLLRTLLSIVTINGTFNFLAGRANNISSEIIKKFLNQNKIQIDQQPSQESAYSLNTGIDKIVIGIIGISVTLVSDVSIIFVLFFGLFLYHPYIAIGCFVYFGLVGWSINKINGEKGKKLTSELARLNINLNEMVFESIQNYRDLVVRNRRPYYVSNLEMYRFRTSEINSILAFLPYVGKYLIESAIVLGGFLLTISTYFFANKGEAVAIIAIFLVASFRIAPSVLRLQQGLLQISMAYGHSLKTFEMIEKLRRLPQELVLDNLNNRNSNFTPSIDFADVEFQYDADSSFRLVIPALKIHSGETVAIVGSSGSGKSTFADLVLGLNPVTHGSIQISGMDPREVHLTHPGSLGYVPQEVYISRGSLRKNLTLGFNESDFSDEEIMISLEKAKLLDFTKKLEKGLYTEIGELGNSLSGGEKQRIGVARSLLTNPKLLILDEATSSLDATTESQLSENILRGEGDLTIVIIAHRLATVKSVERLLYLEDGRIIADGNFEFVKKNVPDFLRQANLFGL